MYGELLGLAVICSLSFAATSDVKYRLSTPIVPSEYHITITPYFETNDIKQFTFDGKVSMQFTTAEKTNQIQLHSEDLNFTVSNINVATTGKTIPLSSANPLEFNKNYTFTYINLDGELDVGVNYTLTIQYAGPIREDLKGFYRNFYMENGVKKWLGATQMEPTNARKVFPCLDEPGLKAEFQLTIERPSNYQPSLTNTAIQSVETASVTGYTREIFYPTPKMSTYLVAFLVSEFDAAKFSQNGTREFGIYVRPEAKSQADFSYEFGIKVEEALSNYFGIDYYSTNSHLRLDHVGLPDFNAGAMENWGLIKYRESLLLYVPETSTPYFKYRVAQIMAHETTHMWFGNLVTCHWWSNTWLNEGFANYFQDYITESVDSNLGAGNMLVIGSVYTAYDADNSPTSPPITNVNVNSPEEISGHFGAITYQKAGSVIRMIHHLIQDEAFKAGLNYYLNENSYNSGYPDKLYAGLTQGVTAYNALSSFPGATIADVMGSWISQAGHPLLHVNIDYTTETVTLTQKRFYIDSSHSSNETYKIPITYTTELAPNFANTKPAFIMENGTYQFKINNISNAHSWVIFNVQETGLYRVNYDDHSWSIISSALKGNNSKDIHYLNRAKIVNDLFAFLYADEVTFSTLYDVLDFLPGESEYSVWFAALRGFNKLWHSYFGDTDALPYIEEYILKHLEFGISRVGYEENETDSFEDLRNRMQILDLACKLGHTGCVEHAVALFKALRQNNTEVQPSLRPVVYCNGLRHGDAEDYDFLWNRLLTTNVANEAWVIEDALGCTSSEDRLKSYLVSRSLANTPIRYQDITVPLTSVLSNYGHLKVVLDSLKTNYTAWTTIYPSINSALSIVASALHTENDFTEFETWLDSCTECTDAAKTAAKSSLNISKASRIWAVNHKADVLKSLKNDSNMVAPSLLLICLLSLVLLMSEK